jgi:hypothetical protein
MVQPFSVDDIGGLGLIGIFAFPKLIGKEVGDAVDWRCKETK